MKKSSLWFGLVVLSVLTICLLPLGSGPGKTAPAPTPAKPAEQKVIQWKGQEDFGRSLAPFGPFKAGYIVLHGNHREWQDWISKATNGRLVIDWAEPGAIYPVTETIDAAGSGVVQIGMGCGLLYPGKFPLGNIECLVFGWDDVQEEYEVFYDYGLYDTIKKAYAEKNVN